MKSVFDLKDVTLYYSETPVLEKINISFYENRISCLIGPSGAGKSTLLRTLNRLNDLNSAFRLSGTVLFENKNIYNGLDVNMLRKNVGIVFQNPCIFPETIYHNVLFGVRRLMPERKKEFPAIVEEMMRAVSLWDETRDRLHRPALELSYGQQQRLAIARALAVEPRVLLLDEPTSALDYKSSGAIDHLVKTLKDRLSVILVTHKLEQAEAIADDVIFICDGKICESGPVHQIFNKPGKIETKCYIHSGNHLS